MTETQIPFTLSGSANPAEKGNVIGIYPSDVIRVIPDTVSGHPTLLSILCVRVDGINQYYQIYGNSNDINRILNSANAGTLCRKKEDLINFIEKHGFAPDSKLRQIAVIGTLLLRGVDKLQEAKAWRMLELDKLERLKKGGLDIMNGELVPLLIP